MNGKIIESQSSVIMGSINLTYFTLKTLTILANTLQRWKLIQLVSLNFTLTLSLTLIITNTVFNLFCFLIFFVWIDTLPHIYWRHLQAYTVSPNNILTPGFFMKPEIRWWSFFFQINFWISLYIYLYFFIGVSYRCHYEPWWSMILFSSLKKSLWKFISSNTVINHMNVQSNPAFEVCFFL